MAPPRQLIPHRIADALARLLGQKHRTAKAVARAYRIDPKTAENLRKGHLSIPTLEKAVDAEGWTLWMALGEAVIGQSYADHLQHRIEETRRVEARIAAQQQIHIALTEARSFQHPDLENRPGS